MRSPKIRIVPILTAWLLAASFTALVLLTFVSVGALEPGTQEGGGFWVGLALLIGFAAGGLVLGVWTDMKPLIAATGVALCSLAVWISINLVFGEATGQTAWTELPVLTIVALLVLQAAAVFVGVRLGRRV